MQRRTPTILPGPVSEIVGGVGLVGGPDLVAQHALVLDDVRLLAQALQPRLVQLALLLLLEPVPRRLLLAVVELGQVGRLARLKAERIPGVPLLERRGPDAARLGD